MADVAYTLAFPDEEQLVGVLKRVLASLEERLLPLAPAITSMTGGGRWFTKERAKGPLTLPRMLRLASYVGAPEDCTDIVEDHCRHVTPALRDAVLAAVQPALEHRTPDVQARVMALLNAPLQLARCAAECRNLTRFIDHLYTFAWRDSHGSEQKLADKVRPVTFIPNYDDVDRGFAHRRDTSDEIVNAGPLVADLNGVVVGALVARGKRQYGEAVEICSWYLDALQDSTLDARGRPKLPHGEATIIARRFGLTSAVERRLQLVVIDAVVRWRDDQIRSGRRPDFT